MTRHIRRGGKVWINVYPDRPLTKKPAETRMGSGKGSPSGGSPTSSRSRAVRARRSAGAAGPRGHAPRHAQAADEVPFVKREVGECSLLATGSSGRARELATTSCLPVAGAERAVQNSVPVATGQLTTTGGCRPCARHRALYTICASASLGLARSPERERGHARSRRGVAAERRVRGAARSRGLVWATQNEDRPRGPGRWTRVSTRSTASHRRTDSGARRSRTPASRRVLVVWSARRLSATKRWRLRGDPEKAK
jgi:hypothetical protein